MSPQAQAATGGDEALVAFVRARLAEEECAALAWPEDEREWQCVGRRRLHYDNGCDEEVSAVDVHNVPALFWERIWIRRDVRGLAAHVVAHDPARALRAAASVRRLIDRYEAAGDARDAARGTVLAGAARINRRAYGEALKFVAETWSDHRDFQPAWNSA